MVNVYLFATAADDARLSYDPVKRFTNLSTFLGSEAWLLECAASETANMADAAIKFSHGFRVRVDPGDITTKHGKTA